MNIHSLRIFICLITILLGTAAQAVPLTEERIKMAQSVTIVTGTFDPITEAQRGFLQSLSSQGRLVLALPTADSPRTNSLPYKLRSDLLEKTIAGSSDIVVPSQGEWSELAAQPHLAQRQLTQKLLELNPHLEIEFVPSESIGIDEVSTSTKIRTLLATHPELYFQDAESRMENPSFQTLVTMISPEIAEEIFNRGLYINKATTASLTFMGATQKWVRSKIEKHLMHLGVYEKIKSALVSVVRNPNLKYVNIHGVNFPLEKYLGSGLSSDAYVMQYQDVRVAIKIPRSARGRQSILDSIPVHLFAQQNGGITSPEILAYDPAGSWIITEFIAGESIPKLISRTGALPPAIELEIEKLRDKVQTLSRGSNITLDFAPDNLIVRDGQVYLVDMGEVPATHMQNITKPSLIQDWVRLYTQPHGPPHRCVGVFQ